MIFLLPFTKRSVLRYDVHVFLLMSTHFWFRLLYFSVMSVSCVFLMNGAIILLWVGMWCILFSMSETVICWTYGFLMVILLARLPWYERKIVKRWTLGFLMVRLWACGFINHVLTSYYQFTINTPSQRNKTETVIVFVELFRPHRYIMAWWKMFDKIVRFVGFAWAPVNEAVYLACPIIDAIESQIHWFEFICLTI